VYSAKTKAEIFSEKEEYKSVYSKQQAKPFRKAQLGQFSYTVLTSTAPSTKS